MIELLLVVLVLVAVWLVAGLLASRWERSRLRRRAVARLRRSWKRAERIVREDDDREEDRTAPPEGDEPSDPPRV